MLSLENGNPVRIQQKDIQDQAAGEIEELLFECHLSETALSE